MPRAVDKMQPRAAKRLERLMKFKANLSTAHLRHGATE
jgi:hypothetical protein